MSKYPAKTAPKNSPLGALYACVYSLPTSLVSGMLLLLLSAAIAYAQADPAVLSRPLSLCSLYLSALLGGIISARKSDNPLLTSLINGTGMVLFLWFLSLFSFGISTPVPAPLLSIGMHAGVIAASVLGSFAGMKRAKRRSVSRNRRRRR